VEHVSSEELYIVKLKAISSIYIIAMCSTEDLLNQTKFWIQQLHDMAF